MVVGEQPVPLGTGLPVRFLLQEGAQNSLAALLGRMGVGKLVVYLGHGRKVMTAGRVERRHRVRKDGRRRQPFPAPVRKKTKIGGQNWLG